MNERTREIMDSSLYTTRMSPSGQVYSVGNGTRDTEYGLLYMGTFVNGEFQPKTEQVTTIYKNRPEVDAWQRVHLEGVHTFQKNKGELLQFHTRVNYSSPTAQQMFMDDWSCVQRVEPFTPEYLMFVYHDKRRVIEVLSSNDTNVQGRMVVDGDSVYGLTEEEYKQFALDKMTDVEWIAPVNA